MADINQIIDQKVIDTLKEMNEELVKAGNNIDKLIPPLNNLNNAQKNITKSTKDQTEQEKQLIEQQKQAEAINKQILTTENKINSLNSEASKLLAKKKLELQQATQSLKDKARANQGEEGSLVRMRQRLKELTLEYDRSGNRTKAAADEINKLSKEIGKAEAATNRHQRNVGNYKSALEGLPGPIGNIVSQAGNLTSTLSKIGPIGAIIGGTIAALSAPLIAFFTKSEQGVEMLERKTAGFKAAWGVLVGEMISGGEKIAETFDKQAEQSTFWTKALSLLGPQFTALGVRMDLASSAAENYTQKIQELEDLERGMIVPRAEANKQIKEAMLLYNDQKKPINERMAALQLAINLENKTADTEIEHQRNVVKNIQTINEEKKKAGQLRDEDDKKLQEAMAREIELSTESMGRQIRATARINAARKELTAGYEESMKKRAEFDKASLDYQEKSAEEELKIWAEQINKKYELGLKQIELEKSVNDTIAKIREDARKTEEEKADDEAEKILERIKKINEEEKKQKEETNKQIFDAGVNLANTLFSLRNSQLQREFEAAEGNVKKQNELKKKMAQAEKRQALFNIAINTASGIMKAIQQTGLPAAIPFVIMTAALGALQAGVVLSQKVPEFAKGTAYAPGGPAMVGEKGRELIKTPGGKIYLANNPALVNLERGSKVLTNRQTEAVLKDGNIVSELRQTRKAIQQIPQPVFLNGSKISERRENYWKNYINQKHLRN